ncbi:MAG: hypothetical protein ACXWNZ_13650 [Vulcanimicrobiaceae bacterium]
MGSTRRFTTQAIAATLLIIVAACGGGGGGSSVVPQSDARNGTGGGSNSGAGATPTPVASGVPVPTSPPATPDPGATPLVPNPTPSPTPVAPPPPTPAPGTGLTFIGLGGYQGDTVTSHHDGDAYEYTEQVVVKFDRKIDLNSFEANYSIKPSTPVSFYLQNYGTSVALTVRKIPGVKYAISMPTSIKGADGTQLSQATTATFTSPASATIPAPIRSTMGQPYYYGVLDHPWTLGGTSGDMEVQAIAGSGARFVRIDYPAANIETAPGVYDFSTEDKIMDKLAAHGITELPIILQYSVPKWRNDNLGYPNIWANPSDFANYAAVIAAHIKQKYPQITRVELFNEPNLHGWWIYPIPGAQYDDHSGVATAIYMKAAYAAIKAVNPRLTIVGPALATGGWHTNAPKFLAAMYGAGCRTGTCWDVLSVHNYAWINPTFYNRPARENRWDNWKLMQQVAAQNGDGTPHVMLTESGWSHAMTADGQDPAVQAQYIALGFNMILADPTVDGVTYVNTNSTGPITNFWNETGLMNDVFAPSPAYTTFHQFASY